VGFHFHAETMHANRLADAFLTIHAETALDNMHNFAVVGYSNRLGGVQRAIDVFLVDHTSRNAHSTLADGGRNLHSSQVDDRRVDLKTGGSLRFLDRTRDAF